MMVLRSNGNFIADRRIDNYSIVLYQLFSFYVEVWYETDLNEIDILCAFSNTHELDAFWRRSIFLALLKQLNIMD